uniref:Putative tRNA pseudouridine synthase 2 n=1 Tax=Schistocephalus solidus TaxID=70667 RepID=A0A0X3NU61_SCHSO
MSKPISETDSQKNWLTVDQTTHLTNREAEFNRLPWENERIRTFVSPASITGSCPVITESVDIVDNPLVLGKRFIPSDFVLNPIDPLEAFSSGVQVFGIGDVGAYVHADALFQSRCLKAYHLTGMFGKASSDGLATGSILCQTPWRHVTRPKLDRALAALEFKARKAAVLHAGLVPNTQKAFKALSQRRIEEGIGGVPRSPDPLRPIVEPLESLPPEQLAPYWDRATDSRIPESLRAKPDPSSLPQLPPSINTLRCVDFSPPFFTVEIQVIHENEQFFVDLVANIGAYLRSASLLSKVRRIRHGCIRLQESLLLKQCTVPLPLYENFVELRLRPSPSEPEVAAKEEETDEAHQESVLSKITSSLPQDCVPNIFTNLLQCTRLHRAQPRYGTAVPIPILLPV